MKYDARSAECTVHTFRDGVLSKLGHDLVLRVGHFEMEIDDQTSSIVARFDAGSLRVERAEGGATSLSEGDKRKIERTISKDVLCAATQPTIEFRSVEVTRHDAEAHIRGELRLNETSRTIHCVARQDDRGWSTTVTVHQPDFGIKPYQAMLGALKLRPDVLVQIRIGS